MTQRLHGISFFGIGFGTLVLSLIFFFPSSAIAYDPYGGPCAGPYCQQKPPCPVRQFVGDLLRPIGNLFHPNRTTVVVPTYVYGTNYPPAQFSPPPAPRSNWDHGSRPQNGRYYPAPPPERTLYSPSRYNPPHHQPHKVGFDPYGPPRHF